MVQAPRVRSTCRTFPMYPYGIGLSPKSRRSGQRGEHQLLEVDDEVLAVHQEAALVGYADLQTVLDRAGQEIVLRADLGVEGHHLLGPLLGHVGPEVVLREAARAPLAVRHPDVEREVWLARIDADREVRPQVVELRLADVAVGIVGGRLPRD